MHWACVVTVQSPFGAQHEPVGGGHGFGEHTPSIVHRPGAGQSTSVVTVQVPSGWQHEPVAGAHGFGVHTPNIVHWPVH